MMGQCFLLVNIDKREFIDPGAKISYCANSWPSMALMLLVASGVREWDLQIEDIGIIGRWAHDHIVVAGDIGEAGIWDYIFDSIANADGKWRDITKDAVAFLVAIGVEDESLISKYSEMEHDNR